MASSDEPLVASRELGTYCSARGGRGRPEGGGAVARDAVEVARACSGCDQHIKKVKRAMVCSCKQAVYCSSECRQESDHEATCRGSEHGWGPQLDHLEQLGRTVLDQVVAYGPSRSRLQQMMGKVKKTADVLAMAEAQNPLAAYLVGSFFASRNVCDDDHHEEICLTKHMERYLKKSVLETDELAIKWLKVAAEGGVPEGMFQLSMKVQEAWPGLVTDRRVAHYWLDRALAAGQMEPVRAILECGLGAWSGLLAGEFLSLANNPMYRGEKKILYLTGPGLSKLLLASRWRELIEWGGKTANGGAFHGGRYFKEYIEAVGQLKLKPSKDGPPPPYAIATATVEEKELEIVFISGRAGVSDALIRSAVKNKERVETNTKFLQGVKGPSNSDLVLVVAEASFSTNINNQIINQVKRNSWIPEHRAQWNPQSKRRSNYLVSCQHSPLQLKNPRTQNLKVVDGAGGGLALQGSAGGDGTGVAYSQGDPMSLDDTMNLKAAGGCGFCIQDAVERIRAVAQGLYNVSLTEVIPDYGYAARYTNDQGIIVHEVFKTYSKPDVVQVLQCLMTCPADLHPVAVAEDQNLYWPIIWYWGSVYAAVLEVCGPATLKKIYGRSLMEARARAVGAELWPLPSTTALAAFPEAAAGEWRVACGAEDCPVFDHEVKFKKCDGCRVRRYCCKACQKKDWGKHKVYCKAGRR